MKFADRHKQSTSVTSTAVITLDAAPAGYRTLAQCIADGDFTVGDTGLYFVVEDASGNMEAGYYTITNATTLTRTSVHRSSNNNVAVTFPAGVKSVFNSVPAEYLKGTSPANLPAITSTEAGDYILVIRASDGALCKILASSLGGSSSTPADATAPTLSSPTGSSTGATTASGTVSTTEGSGTLYWLVSTSSSATATAVKAGSSKAVTATGSQSVTASGLTASTQYYIHYLHRDAAGNDSTVASSEAFTTASAGDTTAPTLSSPTGTQTGALTASGSVSTDEANGTLYRYASTNPNETAATIKAANLTSTVSGTGVQNVTFSGLSASTTYYAHYVHRDAAGNDSAVATSASFTTGASGGGDTTKPAASSASAADATPAKVVIVMSEALDPAYVPAASTVTISGHTVSSLAIASGNLEVTLATTSPFAYGEAARTAAYTPNGTNDLRDLAGNTLDAFTGLAITNNVAQPSFYFDGAASFTTTRNYGASAYVGISSTTYLKVGSPSGTNAGWQTVKDQYDIWGTSIPALQLATWQATPPTSTDSYHDANANTWGLCSNNGTNRVLQISNTFAYKTDHGNPPTEAYAYFKAVPKGAGKDAPAVWHGLYDGLNTGTPVKMTFEA